MYANASNQLGQADAYAKTQSARTEQVTNELAQRISELHSAQEQLENCNRELLASRTETAQLRVHLASREGEAKSLADQAGQLNSTKSQLSELGLQLATIQGELAVLNQAVVSSTESSARLDEANRELETLRTRAADLSRELQVILGSRSWRWTAALRGFTKKEAGRHSDAEQGKG
jgi:DNA repair exonuclease SbcCD ATPase subunit